MYSLIFRLVGLVLVGLFSSSSIMLYPKLPKILGNFVLARKDLDLRNARFIESYLDSWRKAEILLTRMELVENLYTAINLMTKILN